MQDAAERVKAEQAMECGQCGAGLSVPRGAGSVQCWHCGGVTRVQRHGAVGSVVNAIAHRAGGGRWGLTPPGLREAGYPRRHGHKRALLIGINYTGTGKDLSGPMNDVKGMSFLLTQKYGFPPQCILTLTDAERDPYRRPTRSNILLAMQWLVHGSRSGDSLVFHFSGIGGQVEDQHGDEVDGQDETIYPLDWQLNGHIRDNEINDALVRPLLKGVTLHAVIDACNSGTILDLPNVYKLKNNGQPEWEDHSPQNNAFKNTSGGQAILISGCADGQQSMDGIGNEHLHMGLFTYSFVTAAFFAQQPPTYAQLLRTIKEIILERSAASSRINRKLPAAIAPHVRKLVNFRRVQEPQMSSSLELNINREHFEP